MGRYTLKSSKTKLVLSLDPSGNFINGHGKTGYVLARTSDKGYAVLDKGTLDAKDYDSALEFWSAHLDIIEPELDALVVEDYLLYPSVNQSFSYMETPRLIGIIQMHAHILDIPTILQRATETSFLKEAWLVEKGILEKRKGRYWHNKRIYKDHERSALKHFLRWYEKEYKNGFIYKTIKFEALSIPGRT
jgi:hypothetical protein